MQSGFNNARGKKKIWRKAESDNQTETEKRGSEERGVSTQKKDGSQERWGTIKEFASPRNNYRWRCRRGRGWKGEEGRRKKGRFLYYPRAKRPSGTLRPGRIRGIPPPADSCYLGAPGMRAWGAELLWLLFHFFARNNWVFMEFTCNIWFILDNHLRPLHKERRRRFTSVTKGLQSIISMVFLFLLIA